MVKVLIACLMCLFNNWCLAENFRLKNSLQATILPDIIDTVNLTTGLSNIGFVKTGDRIFPWENKYNRQGRYLCKKKKKKKWKKHSKYIIPLIVGWLLIKSILLPIALKALALLSGKAVVLSLMSLILAAIMGLRRLAQGGLLPMALGFSAGPSAYAKYNRQDYLEHENQSDLGDSYDYYQDRRPPN
ncbi:uncharacterized protein LOC130677987 [Microplitis mediator]|uniref:uncharacterized protein LOC130677987 n=1 Tax=Microplitis mediator TaxID=375433 RepID=UPI0025560E19|nr:uncharacterized protein LOC130677987 [Microplitis mediator]